MRQSEPVQSDNAPELRRKMYRRWGNEAVTVERAVFLTQEEAAQVLGRLGVGLLLARRILKPAFLEDGSEGVTREPVELSLSGRRLRTLFGSSAEPLAGSCTSSDSADVVDERRGLSRAHPDATWPSTPGGTSTLSISAAAAEGHAGTSEAL